MKINNNNNLEIMGKRIKTTFTDFTIETFGLNEQQHESAVKAVKEDLRYVNTYHVKEIDEEMIEIWRDDAEDDGNTEYADFLDTAIDNKAEVLVLEDCVGDFKQELGEIIVY